MNLECRDMLKLLPRKTTVTLLLAVSNCLLIPHMLGNRFHRNLCRDLSDTEVRLTNVVPRIFLLAFLRDGYNFVLFLGVRKLHWSVLFVTYNGW